MNVLKKKKKMSECVFVKYFKEASWTTSGVGFTSSPCPEGRKDISRTFLSKEK